jgi:hypothetical protein
MTADDRMAQIKVAFLETLRKRSPNPQVARQLVRQIGSYSEAAFANFIDECVTDMTRKQHH